MAKILLVEDDISVCQAVRDTLEADRHVLDVTHDGDGASSFLDTVQYDLLILDWELPHTSGLSICSRFRKRGGQTPILFLTGRSSMDDKDEGFAVGADDYLTKPFDPRELAARVRALLRRPTQLVTQTLRVGDVELDTNSGEVRRGGNVVRLQPRELALLEFLMKHSGTFFTIEALLTRVWDTDSEATEIALRSCVAKLRRKIDREGEPSFIESVKGLGYRVNSGNHVLSNT